MNHQEPQSAPLLWRHSLGVHDLVPVEGAGGLQVAVQTISESGQEHVHGSGFDFLQPDSSPELCEGISGAQSTEGDCSTEGRANLIGPSSRVPVISYLHGHIMMAPIVKPHRGRDIFLEGVDLNWRETGRLQSHQGRQFGLNSHHTPANVVAASNSFL